MRMALASAACVVLCLALASTRWHAEMGEIALGSRAEVEVPTRMLSAISKELSSDQTTMAALKGKVGKLDRVVSELRLQRASRTGGGRRRLARKQMKASTRTAGRDVGEPHTGDGRGGIAGEGGGDEALSRVGTPPKADSANKEVAVLNTKRMLVEKQMDLVRDFPYWSMNSGLADAAKGHGQAGEWRANRGPPYVQAVTMFAGTGVDKQGSGNLVRRIVGLKTSFRFHKWEGNNFISNFDGPQFRFLYRNVHSSLVIPPLEMSGGPLLGWNAIHRLYLYVNEGENSLIVVGGPASVLFINNNVINKDGGYDLQPKWAPGPYERQKTVDGTPFAACSITLPGPGTQVHGVTIASLPANAVSYYESGDVSVAFSIPSGSGSVLYLGFDFTEPITPWVHMLIAATQFQEFDIKARG